MSRRTKYLILLVLIVIGVFLVWGSCQPSKAQSLDSLKTELIERQAFYGDLVEALNSVGTDTVYVPGDTVVVTDTVYVTRTDTVVVTDTTYVTRTDTVVVADTTYAAQLEAEIILLNDEIAGLLEANGLLADSLDGLLVDIDSLENAAAILRMNNEDLRETIASLEGEIDSLLALPGETLVYRDPPTEEDQLVALQEWADGTGYAVYARGEDTLTVLLGWNTSQATGGDFVFTVTPEMTSQIYRHTYQDYQKYGRWLTDHLQTYDEIEAIVRGDEPEPEPDEPILTWPGGTFSTLSDAVVIPHDPALEIQSGRIEFAFSISSTSGVQGLIGKDALDYGTGGHLGIAVTSGEIQVRMQDLSESHFLTAPITTGEHSFALHFGPSGRQLYLNGSLVASDSYGGGLVGNREPFVIGAIASFTESLSASPLRSPLQGSIGEVRIYE